MTELSVLDETSIWHSAFRRRRRAAYLRAGLGEAAAEQLLATQWERMGEPTVAEILADGVRVGLVAVTAIGGAGRIEELWVHPEHVGMGHEKEARGWAERWCAERGASRVAVQLADPDPLFDDYPIRGQNRLKVVETPAELPGGVAVRPMTEPEYAGWRAVEEETYVFSIVRAGAHDEEQARQKSSADLAQLLPQGLGTPGHSFHVLEAAGRRIGTGWLNHGYLPGVTFGYSLFIEPDQRGSGYGRTAMALGERATVAAGDSALMFTVFGGNEVAMNLYTSAGYRVLTEHRSIELGRGSSEVR
ncbi:GNAT family N-acetyltransferase [Streptacidiphilus sp. P02-A3a]|uniref:GNAT family N-acetyltransferase n=1 Tax=Streptacidiphilus sp. P02-A3a TaxID=2704468 RepID=UPI0015FE40AF|nr:GNAT family N-acetyltransferase [Streptacidiphilus sp. P02-A3a]QMU70513.1 GNAT family N-acetyltransferase [Streptacidiphilus sp. P02-A3a]